MPKLDGIGATYVLKSDMNTRAIPVIMVSVRTDKLDQDYSKEIGADDYLTKPFSVQALLKKLSSMSQLHTPLLPELAERKERK